jgi:hypothetical protein
MVLQLRHKQRHSLKEIFFLHKSPIFYLPTGDTTKSPEDREVKEREEEDDDDEQ